MTEISKSRAAPKTKYQESDVFDQADRVFSAALKRAFDILASVLGLLMLSPFFALIAIGIKRDSDGPVFYRGERSGRGGKSFKMVKFRTMYETPESYNGPPITSNEDDRITPFGRWLRATKLNELPQLWNVLKGEMSLVGPRPEYPDFVAEWPEDVRQKILSLRPGITSPASILYRDEEQRLNGAEFINDYIKDILPDKLRLDQLYVDNHSFFKDLDVIFITLLAILPRIGRKQIKEKTVFSGPFYRFYSMHLAWFLIDFIIAFLAVGMAGVFWRLTQPFHLGMINAIIFAALTALTVSLIGTLLGLHSTVWRYASPALVIDVGLSVVIAAVILVIVDNLVLADISLAPIFVLNFVLITFMGMIAARYRERLFTGVANRWVNARGKNKSFGERVLIIGAGDGGQLAVWLLHKSEYAAAFSIVGFVDDDYHKQQFQIAGLPVLGTTQDIQALVKAQDIGLILYAISKISLSQRARILNLCEQSGARVIAVPDMMAILRDPRGEHYIKDIK